MDLTPHSLTLAGLLSLRIQFSNAFEDLDDIDRIISKEMKRKKKDLCALVGSLPIVAVDWLKVLTTSLDALMDFMSSLCLIKKHLWLRQVSLTWEQMSFEARTCLYDEFCTEVNEALESDQQIIPPLQDEEGQNQQNSLSSANSDIPAVYFSDENSDSANELFQQFLDCRKRGERVGAMDALHAYLDEAATTNKSLLAFSAILLALVYHEQGDSKLSKLATQEAVRVAQQCQDPASVAFSLGWIEQQLENCPNESRDLLLQCAQRATEQNIRSLVAGAKLTLVQRALRHESIKPEWQEWLQTALTDEPVATDAHVLDPPTHLTRGIDELQQRQGIVRMQIYEALDDYDTAALHATILLRQNVVPSQLWPAVQVLARRWLVGSPPTENLTRYFTTSTLNSESVHACALETLWSLQNRVSGLCVSDILLESSRIMHDWAVRRGDFQDAEILGDSLEDASCPSVDRRFNTQLQKAFRMSRQENWDGALEILKSMIQECRDSRLVRLKAKCLLELVDVQINRIAGEGHTHHSPEVSICLPYLMECLHEAERLGMPGVYACALVSWARVQVAWRKRVPEALKTVRSALPGLVRYSPLDYQARAHFVMGDCYVLLSQSPSKSSGDAKDYRNMALAQFEKSAQLYSRCHDSAMLVHVYYQQARTADVCGDLNARDVASKRFVDLQTYRKTSLPTFNIKQMAQGGNEARNILDRKCPGRANV